MSPCVREHLAAKQPPLLPSGQPEIAGLLPARAGVRHYADPLVTPPPKQLIEQIRAACRRQECARFARGGWFGREGDALVLRFDGVGSVTVGAVWTNPPFGTKWMLQCAITGRVDDLATRAGLAA